MIELRWNDIIMIEKLLDEPYWEEFDFYMAKASQNADNNAFTMYNESYHGINGMASNFIYLVTENELVKQCTVSCVESLKKEVSEHGFYLLEKSFIHFFDRWVDVLEDAIRIRRPATDPEVIDLASHEIATFQEAKKTRNLQLMLNLGINIKKHAMSATAGRF